MKSISLRCITSITSIALLAGCSFDGEGSKNSESRIKGDFQKIIDIKTAENQTITEGGRHFVSSAAGISFIPHKNSRPSDYESRALTS